MKTTRTRRTGYTIDPTKLIEGDCVLYQNDPNPDHPTRIRVTGGINELGGFKAEGFVFPLPTHLYLLVVDAWDKEGDHWTRHEDGWWECTTDKVQLQDNWDDLDLVWGPLTLTPPIH